MKNIITICQYIKWLFERESDVEKREVLKIIFMQAKKMNRGLVLNKYGHLPCITGNSWEEADWKKELEGVK